jgi:hypothetical protein
VGARVSGGHHGWLTASTEAQRLALIDKAIGFVDVSQGPHMVQRQTSLQDERREVMETCRKQIEEVERDVKEWQRTMATR